MDAAGQGFVCENTLKHTQEIISPSIIPRSSRLHVCVQRQQRGGAPSLWVRGAHARNAFERQRRRGGSSVLGCGGLGGAGGEGGGGAQGCGGRAEAGKRCAREIPVRREARQTGEAATTAPIDGNRENVRRKAARRTTLFVASGFVVDDSPPRDVRLVEQRGGACARVVRDNQGEIVGPGNGNPFRPKNPRRRRAALVSQRAHSARRVVASMRDRAERGGLDLKERWVVAHACEW